MIILYVRGDFYAKNSIHYNYSEYHKSVKHYCVNYNSIQHSLNHLRKSFRNQLLN